MYIYIYTYSGGDALEKKATLTVVLIGLDDTEALYKTKTVTLVTPIHTTGGTAAPRGKRHVYVDPPMTVFGEEWHKLVREQRTRVLFVFFDFFLFFLQFYWYYILAIFIGIAFLQFIGIGFDFFFFAILLVLFLLGQCGNGCPLQV